jgi:hypothetical protein
MSSINDGSGPAFPTLFIESEYGSGYKGMTLRDYFAAQALAGLLSSGVKSKGWEETIAYDSYKIADAMLVRREIKP